MYPTGMNYTLPGGFLEQGESLLNTMITDNEYVTQTLKLTHIQLIQPIEQIITAHCKKFISEKTPFYVHGDIFMFLTTPTATWLNSPIDSNDFLAVRDGCYTIYNLSKNATCKNVLPGVCELAKKIGFYGGTNIQYRINPQDIVKIFPHLRKETQNT
jgi:hypothetical protein